MAGECYVHCDADAQTGSSRIGALAHWRIGAILCPKVAESAAASTKEFKAKPLRRERENQQWRCWG